MGAPKDRRQRRRKERQRNRAAGKCAKCGEVPPLQHSPNCHVCYLKRAAWRHLGSGERWKELNDLYIQQMGLCAYSGTPIELGKDASVEHVVPLSRSPGGNHIENLRWVNTEVNLSKRSMTLEEFIRLCKAVLRNFGYKVEG